MTDYTAKARELAKTLRQLRVLRPMPEDEDNLIAAAMREAVEAEREAIAVALDDRADEWRRTAADLAGKGAPPELRNHAHDMKDEAQRWAKRVRARGGGQMTAPPDFENLACEVMYSPVGTKKVEAALRSAYAAGAAAERERCADLAHPQRWIGTTCGAPAALEVVRDCIRGVSNPAEPAAHPATGSAEVEAPKRCACGLMLGRSGTCPRCQPEPARPLTLEERAASIVDSPFRIPAVAQLCRDFAREALRVQYEALKGEPYGTQWHYEQHVAAEAALAAAEKGEVPR